MTPGMESEFFTLLDNALDIGISILDENLDYLYLNKAAAGTIGLDQSNFSVGDPLSKIHQLMIGNGIIDANEVNTKLLSEDMLKALYESGEDDYKDITRLNDGSFHKITRHHTANGYTISINQDVTSLVEKEALLQTALSLGKSGYWIYDFATKKTDVSPSLFSLLSEGERAELDRRGVVAIVHKDDRAKFKHAIKSLHVNNGTLTVIHRNANGDKWFRTTGNAERNVDGKLCRLRAFMKDITDSKLQAEALEKAKDEAVAANIAKSDFLANMSHEIRTPMNGVLGMVELLEESGIDDKQKEFVQVIARSSTALLSIINDILDFSKIEAGALELDPVPFDIRQAINDVISLLQVKAKEKGLELIINYPLDQESSFIGDAGRFRQIITNLVGNSIKFTEDGHIRIDVNVSPYSSARGKVDISVTDTGIGIDESKLSTIFDKFTQADNSTTRVYGGTGLGLSISKKLVEIMGGSMTAKSQLDQGSTFSFSLPLPINAAAPNFIEDRLELSGKRALIVDDLEVNRDILSKRLSSWGMNVTKAANSADAILAVNKQIDLDSPFDFILLDYQMPGMNGHELAALLNSNAQQKQTPIVLLSSSDVPASTSELKTLGIEETLMKPVREKQLFECLEAISTTPVSTNENIPVPVPPPSNRAINVLVAEDFPLNQDVVRLMLVDTKFNPVFANNGKEAMEKFAADPNQFQAVLMDISMPVMDGYEATDAIRNIEASRNLPRIPIIALTGHALKHDREKCFEANMDDYLTKPVKPEELESVLSKWIMHQGNLARTA